MIEQKTGIIYQYRKPKTQQVKGAIFMLHGYGSHELDLFSLADELQDDRHIFSLRAPYKLPWGGYCWYNLEFSATGHVSGQNIEEAVTSRDLIKSFIESTSVNYSIPEGKNILMGFSQGAILGYSVALTYPEIVDALIAMSGYINNLILPENILYDRLRHLDFLITHGTEDPVIPYEWAKKSAEFLEKNKLNHRFFGYQAGHGIDAQTLTEIKKFISKKTF
ncbi:MAG: alpha/beta hydrolase [Thermaurantimonas sp.]